MLAYETLQMCRDDLVKYKLNIQSVPVVSGGGGVSSDAGAKLVTASASYSSSVELQSKSNPNNNKCFRTTTITNSVSKSYTLNPKLNSSDTHMYEDVLDCKSCTLQGF